MTMKIKIKKARIYRAGDSSVITIPSAFINNHVLEIGKRYDVILEETKEGKNDE